MKKSMESGDRECRSISSRIPAATSEGLVDRSGGGLGEFEAVGIGVVEGEVGESPPDIDAQSVAHGLMFLLRASMAATALSKAFARSRGV